MVGCCRLSPGSTVDSAKWDSEISAIAPLLSVGMSVIGLFTADGLADTLAEPLKGMAKSIKAASGRGRTLAAIALAEGHVRLHLLKDGENQLTDREVRSAPSDFPSLVLPIVPPHHHPHQLHLLAHLASAPGKPSHIWPTNMRLNVGIVCSQAPCTEVDMSTLRR